MSSRVAVDIFGNGLNDGSSSDGLSLHDGDRRYLNVTGSDQMLSDLDMNNQAVKNLKTLIEAGDAVNKAYVDNQVAASNSLLNEALTRVKFKLIPGSSVLVQRLGNDRDFSHNFFLQGVWYLGSDRITWYDSRSEHCKKLKVDFRTDGNTLTIRCKNNILPTEVTGNGVLLLKRDIIGAVIDTTSGTLLRETRAVPSWLPDAVSEARKLQGS